LLRTARAAGFGRWLARNLGDTGNHRADGIPVWSGEQDLHGKRRLVAHQMGFGDQFLLFACQAQWRVAGARLMVICDPQVQTQLQASLPDCLVVRVWGARVFATGLRPQPLRRLSPAKRRRSPTPSHRLSNGRYARPMATQPMGC